MKRQKSNVTPISESLPAPSPPGGGGGDDSAARLVAVEARVIEVEKSLVEIKTEMRHLATKDEIQNMLIKLLMWGIPIAFSVGSGIAVTALKLFYTHRLHPGPLQRARRGVDGAAAGHDIIHQPDMRMTDARGAKCAFHIVPPRGMAEADLRHGVFNAPQFAMADFDAEVAADLSRDFERLIEAAPAQAFAMQRHRHQHIRPRRRPRPRMPAEHRAERAGMAELVMVFEHADLPGDRLAILERNDRMLILRRRRLTTAAYAGLGQFRAADFACGDNPRQQPPAVIAEAAFGARRAQRAAARQQRIEHRDGAAHGIHFINWHVSIET